MMRITTLVIKLIIIVNITFAIAKPTNIRCCHGSTIINSKLYIGGGIVGPADKKHSNLLIKCSGHALVYAVNKGGGMIYLFSGFRGEPKGSAIYGYSLKLNAWSEVTPGGAIMPAESTTKVFGVTDSNLNTIYILVNSTMYIYNAFENFLYISTNLPPYQIYYYATVMLNTSEIAFIGGGNGTNRVNNNHNNIPMNQILLYNTKISSWYIKNAKGTNGMIPSPRQGHSASIAPDGRIFVYGGFDGNGSAIESVGSHPVFTVLEYVNGEFVWSTPKLFGQLFQFRIYHTSHVFGNYLFIAFGRNLTHSRLNTIDTIDISNRDNYIVVTDFVPPGYVPPISSSSSSSPPSPPSASNKNNKNITIASVFGSVGALIIVIGCAYFFIRRYRYQNVIPTPGNDRT
ncbi:hypothetical protein GLOIN_2v1772753 [Rhizophagus clarus]|uniref:Kelch repeat protein n=1 Tax=Rhizophagus clarus TaxID=94130 RepID=A0A8H3M2C5_9GLOM|nr:hypothetical protein GLOIN_2v1772753 [Rhizophagus clarus]